MIAVLGGLADVERDLIRTRTAEGRSRAKARGQHMGRPSKLTDAQKAEARQRRAEGATLKELARSYDVGRGDDFAARIVISLVCIPRGTRKRWTYRSSWRSSAKAEPYWEPLWAAASSRGATTSLPEGGSGWNLQQHVA